MLLQRFTSPICLLCWLFVTACTVGMFKSLMIIQAIGLLGLAIWWTSQTWSGTESSVHAHVWMASALGLLITVFPAMLAAARPGHLQTRLVMAVCQGLVSGLLIHIGGGRLEKHFHIFVSLAFLAVYMDTKVLFAMTAVVATDHLILGLMRPQSIYGINEAGVLRTLEHAAWVIGEDTERCVSRVGESTKCTSQIRFQLGEILDIVRSTDGVITKIQTSVTSSASEAEQLADAFGGRKTARRLESVSSRYVTW